MIDAARTPSAIASSARVLAGGGVLATAAGGLAALAVWPVGAGLALSVGAGALVALACLVSVPLLLLVTAKLPPPATMSIGVVGYVVMVIAGAQAYLQLVGEPWLHGGAAAGGVAAAGAGWVAGVMRTARRLRMPVFDVVAGAGRPGRSGPADGSPASPGGGGH